ncbi:lipoprotein [Sphaerisporangium krabiense]|uniref:Uncharacterized protein (DUF305 family) n=1 Tax=Sphaerisporangium krabiense TaxID=763782 RepID=A0A7W9DTP8_9ACTN|nr:DUF305 domain-containing protein [Sphaerisporangium krabiense]MBB5630831.1 uncharacterized protein (DUF305 family) [Sphaerisporangium krabiense]GII65486.1 lipoprotein [Sphaerisporangium krabiense]
MLASGLGTILAGCTGDPAGERAPIVVGSGAPVVVPGAPGQDARTATPGERLGREESRASAADVLFAERMIPHHRQALEMAGLAPARASDPRVRALCERIVAAQRPEIDVMSRWLRALGRDVPAEHSGHGADGSGEPDRYGMAGLEEMNRLRAARGEAFDALLLRLMIRHHEGAVAMAEEERAGGTDRILRAMAKDVVAGQRAEIVRMRALER